MSEKMLGQILDALQTMNTRLEQVDTRLEKVEVRLEQMDTRLEKVEVRLEQMDTRLEKVEVRLEQVDTRLEKVEGRLENVEGRIDAIEVDLKSIKNDTKEIPFIKQAVHETYEITKQISSSQASFERQASKDINMHSHSIDILNRRQLKLEAEIEHIKQK